MLLLDEAMRWHIGVQITEGIRIVFDRVPPEFSGTANQLAQVQRPIIDLQPAPDWSWPIVLHVRTDRGELDVPMSLYEVPPEAGYDHTLRGVFHNLSFSMSQHKKLDGTVDSNYRWRLHPSQLPARDRLAALDFLYASSGRGELQWESSVPELPSTTMGMDGEDLDRSLLVDRAFFSDLVAVEDWTNDRFRVPESASAEEVYELAKAAATIRARRCTVLWEGSTWRLPRVDAPRVGRCEEEPIPMAVESEILGKVVQLGFATGTARYEVTAVEDIPHEPDRVAVTITPQDERSKVVPVEDLQRVIVKCCG